MSRHPERPPGIDAPYELRTPTAEDLRRFLAPLPKAFGEEYTDAEFEADSHTFEPERIVAAFDGDESVGCAGAYSVRLTIPGGEVDAAAVTLVAVSPSHHRRGILRSLMRHQLDEVRERAEPVAILWASEGAIYQRFGYGLATLNGTFDIERARTVFAHQAEPEGRIRIVMPDEAERQFPQVYERTRVATPGALSRSGAWWHWNILRDADYMRRGSGPKYLALYEVDGEPEGYAIYRVKSDWDHRGPRNELQVCEVVAPTARAERDLWRWLLDIDLVAQVKGVHQPAMHPLLLLLAEPRRLGLSLGDGLWLRIVDLPAALAARSYAASGELVLEVSDAFCPWNAGRWRLAAPAADGPAPHDGSAPRARVTPADDAADLAMDVTDLGAVYLGGFRFGDLLRAGRIEERRPGAVAAADRLFATDRWPWCSTMF